MSGWVKLHRKFNDWEWRNSPKHVAVFLDLLLNANHKEKKYRGVPIGAGQLTTSYQAISNRTGVTIRGVRTVLKDLISTHEVTHKGRRHYSIITIVNWEKYQVIDTPNDIVMTSRRQPSDNLVTTNKNEKNEKNEKNIMGGKVLPELKKWESFFSQITIATQKIFVREYQIEYIEQCVEDASIWLEDNPKKKIGAFFSGWLKRGYDDWLRKNNRWPKKAEDKLIIPPMTDEEWPWPELLD